MTDGLLDLYVTFLRAERNVAARTVDAYARDVRDWLDELGRRGRAIDAATRDDVLEHREAPRCPARLPPVPRGREAGAWQPHR